MSQQQRKAIHAGLLNDVAESSASETSLGEDKCVAVIIKNSEQMV